MIRRNTLFGTITALAAAVALARFVANHRERLRPPGAFAGWRLALLKRVTAALKAPRPPSFLQSDLHSEYRLWSNA